MEDVFDRWGSIIAQPNLGALVSSTLNLEVVRIIFGPWKANDTGKTLLLKLVGGEQNTCLPCLLGGAIACDSDRNTAQVIFWLG